MLAALDEMSRLPVRAVRAQATLATLGFRRSAKKPLKTSEFPVYRSKNNRLLSRAPHSQGPRLDLRHLLFRARGQMQAHLAAA